MGSIARLIHPLSNRKKYLIEFRSVLLVEALHCPDILHYNLLQMERAMVMIRNLSRSMKVSTTIYQHRRNKLNVLKKDVDLASSLPMSIVFNSLMMIKMILIRIEHVVLDIDRQNDRHR